jgi:hypothetical protein
LESNASDFVGDPDCIFGLDGAAFFATLPLHYEADVPHETRAGEEDCVDTQEHGDAMMNSHGSGRNETDARFSRRRFLTTIRRHQ